MTSNSKPFISYFIKANKYAGTCVACDTKVAEGAGFTQKNRDVWETLCLACVQKHGRAIPTNIHYPSLSAGHPGGDGYKCATCGMEIALVKSMKTDKWYFCTVGTSDAGNLYAMTHQPHTAEECDRRVADDQAMMPHDEEEEF